MRATWNAPLPALLAGAVLVSCQPALFVPRYEPMAQRPLAVLTGTLAVNDGCLWIVTDTDRCLALWPSTFKIRAEGDVVTVEDDGVEASTSDQLTVVGGAYEIGQTGFVQELIGQPVPEACLDLYWLVTELLAEPLPTPDPSQLP